MNRRYFTKSVGASVAALGLGRSTFAAASVDPPQVAVTMDDFVLFDTPTLTYVARDQAIRDVLAKHKLKAALFVTTKYLTDDAKSDLLREWDRGGHVIANHTHSHMRYPDADFRLFTADILRAEARLERLPRYRKLFRFPYLKEGKTIEQRDRMRAFLKAEDYRNGHVTVDASDWYIDGRLRDRLKREPTADITPYKQFYLDHIWERAQFYDDLARRAVGRRVRHTLLIHHNVLNGLFLADLLGMFKSRGWKLIDAETAFADPFFASEPKITPAGESLVWAVAKETGKFDKLLRYPAEDGEYERAKMDALGL